VSKVPMWRVAVLLACAALTRETAVLIIAGYALYLVTTKQFRGAATIVASALPAAVWFLYLGREEASPVISYATWIPLAGFMDRLIHPASYSGAAWKTAIALACDYLALAGIAITLVVTARLALTRKWEPQTSALYALAIAAIFIGSRGVWQEADAFGRVLTPLLLLAFLQYFDRRPWLAFTPILMVDTPIALTLWQQAAGIAKGLVR